MTASQELNIAPAILDLPRWVDLIAQAWRTEALIRRVVLAVQGYKEDGENSEVYAAMRFVPRSQRARLADVRRKW